MMTVLITGASSGIGAGLAKSFAADGHPVIACGRDPSRLAALQRHSPNISLRSFDMTDREACRQALAECRADLIILQSGVNLVCQQPAPGLGAERHCHHGGLAGIRRYPADAQKRFFHARPGERGARGKGDSPRSGER